ncbi:MAG: SufE family protein [Alistipes sp.]|nr:SufE family protein [Alistipes sp.]
MKQDAIQEAIIEEFSMFDDWLDKYDYLISLSDSLPLIDEGKRTEKYLIEGCQSRVWVSSEMRDGKVYYAADSDAIITKGIITLLIRVMSGRAPEEIADIDLYFIDAIGLGENLSPTRSNGLRAMVAQMKLDARVFAQMQK